MSSDEDVEMSLSDRLARTERRQVQAMEREAEAKEIDNSCPICLDQLENEYANVDACTHRFHSQCIMNWSTVQNTCPLCNARFVSVVTRAVAIVDAKVERVEKKVVKDTDQTEKSFRGDLARDYVAEGAAYARQMREEARRKRVEACQQKLNAKPRRKRAPPVCSRASAASVEAPSPLTPPSFSEPELSSIWSASVFPSLSAPSRSLTARQAARLAARSEVKQGVFLEPLPVKRRAKPKRVEPSEEEQERWAIEESLRLTAVYGLEHDVSDDEGDESGNSECEERQIRSKRGRKSAKTTSPTKTARSMVHEQKVRTPVVREVAEEQGIKWIRSKITGKWIRARVSSISLAPKTSSAAAISSSLSSSLLLAEEMRKIQAPSELNKQSAEATEVEARMLSFQSRISDFRRKAAASAPRSKLTIDALRTDPHLLLCASEQPTDSAESKEKAIASSDCSVDLSESAYNEGLTPPVALYNSSKEALSLQPDSPTCQSTQLLSEMSLSTSHKSADPIVKSSSVIPLLCRGLSLPSTSSSFPPTLSRALTDVARVQTEVSLPKLSNLKVAKCLLR